MVTVNHNLIHHEQVPQNFYFDLRLRPHRYFLELVLGERQKVVDAIEMPLVQSLQASSPAALVATETVNGHYDEEEGFRVRTFKLTGKSGFTRLDLQYFHRFRNFVENAKRLGRENKNAFVRGVDYRLVLNFPWEGESFYCNVIEFVYDRQRQRESLSLMWGIELRTYGYATRKFAIPRRQHDFISRQCEPDDDRCHMAPGHPCRKLAYTSLQELPPGWEDRASEYLGPVEEKIDHLGGWENLSQAQRIRDGRDNLSQAQKEDPANLSHHQLRVPSAVESFPVGTGATQRERFGAVANLYGLVVWAYEDLSEAMQVASDLNREGTLHLLNILGWLSNVAMECKTIFGSSRKQLPFRLANYVTKGVLGEVRTSARAVWAATEAFGNTVEAIFGSSNEYDRHQGDRVYATAEGTPVIETTVQHGEHTVHDVARRVLGGYGLGNLIVDLWSMIDARTWGNGTALEPGDVVAVPAINGLPAQRNATMLGEDWLVQNGDWVLNDEGDDFVWVTGEACYLQDMKHRFLTKKNEIRIHPDVGLLPMQDYMDPQFNPGKFLSDVRGQAMADHRTAAIRAMTYKDVPGAGEVDIVIQAVTESHHAFAVALPKG